MMRWLKDLGFRVRALVFRSRMERELREEMADHLRREAERNEAAGMSPEEARRAAAVRFGGEERFREQARESWGVTALIDLGGDVRFAWRQLRKNPAFSVLAVLTLALGIGGTVALSSVVYGVLLRPLPMPDAQRVVTWWSDYNWRGAEFDHVRDVAQAYESLASFSNDGYTLRTESGSSVVVGTVASAELFEVLDVPPLLGRTFRPGDDRPGAEPIVVLSHSLWSQEFGSDPEIVGRRIELAGAPRTVVGVMPEGFYFPSPDMSLFVPLNLDPADPAYAGNGWLVLVGRLRTDVTEDQVQTDLERVTQALGERFEYPAAWDKTRNPYVVPIREYLFGEVRPALLVLLGAVGLLLLMACVNVAALLLTKTVDRTREVAVRAALGAGRTRLARQVLTESVVLGLVSGAVGVGLAVALFDVLVASLPLQPSFRETLSLDWTTLLSALCLAVAVGCLVAIAPMRSLLRGDFSGVSVSDRTGGPGLRESRMQNVLVVAEVLLAVVLVTGASLLVRTVGHLQAIDVGFETEGLLTMGLLLPEEQSTRAERAAFYEQLVERSPAMPDVESVTLVNRLPLRDGGFQGPVGIPDRPDLQGAARPNAMYRPMTVGGFETLGAEIIEGRSIIGTDGPDAPVVAVINETFARRVWGDGPVVGRRFTSGFFEGEAEVVGVVRNMAVTDLVGEPPMVAYYSWDQTRRGAAGAILVARVSSGDPAAVAPALRSLVAEIHPRAAVGRIETMQEAVEGKMAEALRLRFFLGLFSLLGIVLGSVGVYGVVSYSVQRRRTEFGIRMALGAEPHRLLGKVLWRGLVPVVGGIVAGTVAALFASRLLTGFLFEVSPVDPVSILSAAGVLLLVGAAASLLPALRASATRPATALRAE